MGKRARKMSLGLHLVTGSMMLLCMMVLLLLLLLLLLLMVMMLLLVNIPHCLIVSKLRYVGRYVLTNIGYETKK